MRTSAQSFEPPATLSGIRFTVGRDRHGRWVVCDRDGLVGGIFTDRQSAVHFAIFESDHLPGAVCCVPDHVTLTLDLMPTHRPAQEVPQRLPNGPLKKYGQGLGRC